MLEEEHHLKVVGSMPALADVVLGANSGKGHTCKPRVLHANFC